MRSPILFVLALPLLLAGCSASYVTPGGPAKLSYFDAAAEQRQALTDGSIRTALSRQPLVTFPASIAVAHIQAAGYQAYYLHVAPVAVGNYSIVTQRDVETDDDFKQLAALPRVADVAPLSRILFDQAPGNDLELRMAAAKLHADLLLCYTFDTCFTSDSRIPPLGVITLGAFPERQASATTTCSAMLLDVRDGYLYGVYEASASDHQLANAWTSADAMDQVRRRVERDAFTQTLAEFQKQWPTVVARYDHPATAAR